MNHYLCSNSNRDVIIVSIKHYVNDSEKRRKEAILQKAQEMLGSTAFICRKLNYPDYSDLTNIFKVSTTQATRFWAKQ